MLPFIVWIRIVHPSTSRQGLRDSDRNIAMAKLAFPLAAAGMALAYYKIGASSSTQFEIMSALGPTFRLLDPETSHNMGILAAKWGLFPTVS